MGDGWVGVNTHMANTLIEAVLQKGFLPGWGPIESFRREVVYPGGGSRVDFLAQTRQGPLWIEVKNTTLLLQEGNRIAFPDAVTARGLKHLRDLEKRVTCGEAACLVFLVNRPGGISFCPASHVDPIWSQTFAQVVAGGVKAVALRFPFTLPDFEMPISIPWSTTRTPHTPC